MTITITTTWRRIEVWLAANAPQMLAQLKPPASPDALEHAQKILGLRFPADVCALYSLHDGQGRNGMGLLDGCIWLDLENVVSNWKVWKQLFDAGEFAYSQTVHDPEVRGDWWNPGWVPLTHDGGGDYHCLDMAPAAGGVAGQIIMVWHNSEERPLIATGVHEWLIELAEELESGVRVYDNHWEALLRVGEA